MAGKEHELSEYCWCEPDIEEEYDDDGNSLGRVVIHKETH